MLTQRERHFKPPNSPNFSGSEELCRVQDFIVPNCALCFVESILGVSDRPRPVILPVCVLRDAVEDIVYYIPPMSPL
jgi:hypothetical protein